MIVNNKIQVYSQYFRLGFIFIMMGLIVIVMFIFLITKNGGVTNIPNIPSPSGLANATSFGSNGSISSTVKYVGFAPISRSSSFRIPDNFTTVTNSGASYMFRGSYANLESEIFVSISRNLDVIDLKTYSEKPLSVQDQPIQSTESAMFRDFKGIKHTYLNYDKTKVIHRYVIGVPQYRFTNIPQEFHTFIFGYSEGREFAIEDIAKVKLRVTDFENQFFKDYRFEEIDTIK